MRALILATTVSLAALGFAAPASAQWESTVRAGGKSGADANQPATAAKPVAVSAAAASQSYCPLDISNGARPKLVAYQNAVIAKAPDASAKLAEAQGVARKPSEICLLNQFKLWAAINGNDLAGQQTAFDAMLATGVADKGKIAPELLNLGKLRYNAKDFVGAGLAFEKARTLMPTSSEPLVLLAETQLAGNQPGVAIATYKSALALPGAKPDEQFMKRAIGVAMKVSPNDVVPLARDWAGAFPSAISWREAINLYVKSSGKGEPDNIDIRRLQFAANALAGENEYGVFALVLNGKGMPTEALKVLEAGVKAVKIRPTSSSISTVMTKAKAGVAAEKAGLAAKTTAGLAASATFDAAMKAGDANYGAGNYAKAAELYRAALTKSGANTNLANLRLGMSLAMAGDKAGAGTALAAAGGDQAMVASFWQAWLKTRA